MRILITDDSVFMRSAIGRALAEQPDFEIVGKARHGREAVELAKQLRPDVVTMDIEMPEMDGLTALRQIMRQSPTQVLMCSTLTTEGSRQSLQALRMGAADVIPKETSPRPAARKLFLEDLIRRVRGLGESSRHRPTAPPHTPGVEPTAAPNPTQASDPTPTLDTHRFELLCIASSTGGPPVLETLLTAMPATLRLPVVIGQHMPRIFTQSMAERFNDICPLPVVHAEHRTTLEPGRVYIAPGGQHTHIERASLAQCRLKINDEPRDALYKPSADALFSSAAEACGSRVLGVILTGIGDDGLRGAGQLHKAGAPILAQSQRTCVVYGMPRAVAQAGYATASLDPEAIAATLQQLAPRAAA
ncbi:MAG: chemotaxis response regulator protein-glutamate methylesterase [Planctomycetota bacterium]